jgi:hypothetical protein
LDEYLANLTPADDAFGNAFEQYGVDNTGFPMGELGKFAGEFNPELDPSASYNLTDMGLGGFDNNDFNPNDPIQQASLTMFKQPRVSLPSGLEQGQQQYPQIAEGSQYYTYGNYEPTNDSQQLNGYQMTGYQPMDPFQQGIDSDQFFPQPQYVVYNDQEQDSLFFPDDTQNVHQSRKRGASQSSSTNGDGPRKKLRSQYSNNSDYSAHSRSSSLTDDSERRRLKNMRKVTKRASHYTPYTFKPEKPKPRDDKPWIRTNNTTKGLTTRTAKINKYQPVYEDRPHPLGDAWISVSGNLFTYTEKCEFSEKTYSAEQIRDFIFNYPKNKKTHAKLKLWIQKAPTDSARRYVSPWHAKCRFKECPAHLYQTGTILHGHYRVAFDERWHAHHLNVDPFHVAGFAHLYCMERFLDFEAVCKLGIVEVDDRAMPHEPKGRFAGTLAGQPEFGIAQDFVLTAAEGVLRTETEEFQNYPVHSHFKRGQPKPHEDTLTYWMHKHKNDARPKAQIMQFDERKLAPSHILVHLGDLEVSFAGNPKRQKMVQKAKAKGKYFYDTEAIVAARLAKAHTEAEKKTGGARKDPQSSGTNKRKRPFDELSDDEDSGPDMGHGDSDSEDDYRQPGPPVQGVRKSPRLSKKPRQVYFPSSPTGDPELDRAMALVEDRMRKNQAEKNQTQANQFENQHVYDGYQPAAGVSSDDMPTYTWDPEDPDIDIEEMKKLLHRRQSSFSGSIGRHSRGPSLLMSRSSRRSAGRPSHGRRVSTFGGVTTQYFDKTAAPEGVRRSPRVLGSPPVLRGGVQKNKR